MSVREGDRAPGFELPAAPGETVDVGELIGRETVVLFFFPLAFSPVCTKEMRTVRDGWEGWRELDARVFGISVDSPFVTEKFRREEDLPFPLLSDFNREVSRAYDVLHEDLLGLKGVAKRAAFVIGPDGVVRHAWASDDPRVEPDYEAVRAAAAEV